MADEPTTASVTPGNAPEARSPTGEIVDQQAATTPPATEAKPTEPAPAEGEKKPEPQAVPEKYEFKVPDGQQLNEALVAEATPLFKEMGLSQENAQKLFDFHNKTVAEAAAAPMKAYEEMRDAGRKEIVADKDLGDGKSDLKPEVKATIAKAIDALPNAKEFRAAMDLTGVGDNPAFVRAFAHMAKQLAEGTPVRGSGPSPAGQTAPGAASRTSPAQALYPNLPSSAG